nr:unnamed protein product [Spirometra erinaceieuropaei]
MYSTAHLRSPTPPTTWTSSLPAQKQSESCNNSPAEKHRDPVRSRLKYTIIATPTDGQTYDNVPGYVDKFLGIPRTRQSSIMRNGSRQIFNNYDDISLLNSTEKIFVRVPCNRLKTHLEKAPPGKPVQIPKVALNVLYDFRGPKTEEVSGDAEPPLHCHRGPDEDPGHGQSRWTP